MAFSDYKNLAQVQEEFQIRYEEKNFVSELPIDIPESFILELDFNLSNLDAFSSEAARCELILFPVLREIYKNYYQTTALWIQKNFGFNPKLSGTCDYLLSQKSELGKTILGFPLLMLIEAKRNDFEQGWGQCLAELVAADYLNRHQRRVYGIVSDGKLWEFGYLDQKVFTKNITSYTITNFQQLFYALNHLFTLATADIHKT